MANGVAFPLSPPGESLTPRGPKACAPCAHLKVRCVTDAGEGVCKRCRRLGKVCGVQTPGSQSRKKPKPSTVARLEQKLDGVAAILAASERDRLAGRRDQETPVQRGPVLSPLDCLQQNIQDDDELQRTLDVFRAEMAPYFPFVVIQATASLADLKQNRPFVLLNAIIAGCRHDKKAQTSMALAFREMLSQRAVVRGDPSLDLLQGLLIYVAWYHVHFHLGSRLSALAHLLMSLLFDLGLHRPVNVKYIPKCLGITYFHRARESLTTRTLEERRTFLGCYYVMFIISMNSRDLEPLRYSQYADRCYRVISEAPEYPSDMHLVRLTQLCSLGERIARRLKSDDCETSTGISAPIGACVRSFEAELQTLKTEFSSSPPSQNSRTETGTSTAHHTTLDNPALLTFYFQCLEQLLYETALNDTIDESRYGTYPLNRLDMLFACLNSTQLCLEAFYALPIQDYVNMPYLTWTQMGHAMVILSKLSVLRMDGWDLGYVQSVLDFPVVIDSVLVRFEEARSAMELAIREARGIGGGDGGADAVVRDIPEILSNFAPKFQLMKEVHEIERAALLTEPGDPTGGPTLTRFGNDDDLNGFSSPALFDFLDESFWQPFA